MVSIFEVAGYVLNNREQTTAWQLQKLCYYSKAWSLALNNEPLFPEHFGAWKNGPVCRPLYKKHEGMRIVPKRTFEYKDNSLRDEDKAIIKSVLCKYGGKSGEELSEMTHHEMPWMIARKGIPEGQNSNRNVNETIMRDYYITQKSDYEEMENNMLFFLAEAREEHAGEKKSLREVMELFNIKGEDVM